MVAQVRKQQTLRLVLAMIIFDALVLHIPMIVFTYGSNSPSANHWTGIFNVYERLQLTWFCVQETIISTIYITATVRLLGSIYHSMTRTIMFQLVLINCICIGMDVVLIALEYSNYYVGEAALKGMIYAIKLKLEFAVLNQLMNLTKAGLTEAAHVSENRNQNDVELHHANRRGSRKTLSDTETADGSPPPRKESLRSWFPFNKVQASHHRQSIRLADDPTTNLAAAPQEPKILRTQQVQVTSAPRYSAANFAAATVAAASHRGSESSETILNGDSILNGDTHDFGVKGMDNYSMKQ